MLSSFLHSSVDRVRQRFIAALAGASATVLSSCSAVSSQGTSDPVVVAAVTDVTGVPDNGLDPSAVVLTNARGVTCSGVLLASDVVLTARSCVSADAAWSPCLPDGGPPGPAARPLSIHAYSGIPSAATWVASGIAIFTPAGGDPCGGDLALVVLNVPIVGAAPVLASESGIAEGGHVRTVAYDLTGTLSPTEGELLREHLPVVALGPGEFAVGQATCIAAVGSPAYDETTGRVVGVLSRWGSRCGGEAQFDVYTRVDAYYDLVQEALAWTPPPALAAYDEGEDAGHKRVVARAKKPPTDIGAACIAPTDCGTGLCVTAAGSEYCSRLCAPADRCPADYKCVIAASGESVCVQS